MSFAFRAIVLLVVLLSGFSAHSQVVISEVMYHPLSALTTEEFIELWNVGTNDVNLSGYRFTKGVSFTIPGGGVLPAGGLLVVAADTNAFAAKYPAVTNFTGNWTGQLNNTDETIRLEDSAGNEVDEVFYADEGDYATRVRGVRDYNHYGWDWQAEHDGGGKSLERINPSLTGKSGQNWKASTPTNGTPGDVNSANATNIAPLIRDVAHYPLIPRSTDTVTITARLTDEQTNGLTATLYWRNASTASPAAFTAAAMFDDGAHGDGLAGDRLFGAVLSANTNRAVIAYYVSASDAQANTRTWPAPARESNGTPIQACNALYQVDDSTTDLTRPSYRLVMTKSEHDELYSIPNEGSPANYSHAAFNGAFIAYDGTTTEVRQNCLFRNRGASGRSAQPPNYRVNIPSDRRWSGVTALNLNSQYTHSQIGGWAVAASAGLPTEQHRRVQVRMNGVERASSGSPQFGAYVHQEAQDSDFTANHWPTDGNGNLYRAAWANGNFVNLDYLGTNYIVYQTKGYAKASNKSENDWTDLIQLTIAMSATPDSEYWTNLQANANVDQWLRYFAVVSLVGSEETCLGTGTADDYTMYRGILDPRFQLAGHDWDSVLGQGSLSVNPNASLFRATSVPNINRFLKHPEVAPRYYAELLHQLATTFAPGEMSHILNESLGRWVPSATVTAMKTFATNRYVGALAQIPLIETVDGSSPSPFVTNGIWSYTNAEVTFNGKAHAARTRMVKVNGADAQWTAWRAVWTNTVTLQPGLNTILVQSLDTNGLVAGHVSQLVWYDAGTPPQATGGTITSNTTWTAAGGPHHVTNSLTVANGVTLTIEPGTTVYLGSGVNFIVANGGQLLAEGTGTNRIHFSGVEPGAAPTWGGIIINGGAGSPETRLAHAHLEGNNSTCISVSAGTVFLDHLTFSTTTRQYLSLNAASFVVQDCLFPTMTAALEPVHGSGGIKSGGRGLFLRNFFGAANGYNDVVDFSGGNRPGPILHFIDNVFIGTGDDILDLDGTDTWIEGNIFMHTHKNGAPDTASAISGGSGGGATSEVTIIGNIFYDCDQAAMGKQGNFYTLFNNTIVRQTREGGLDTAGAVIALADSGTAQAAGMYLEGNIVSDAEGLTRNVTTAVVTFTNNLLHNVAGAPWAGPGGGNITNAPLFKYTPQNSETTNFNSWAAAQVIKEWFALRSGSPARGRGPNGRDLGGAIPLGASISGEPPAITPATNATLVVGVRRTGNGIPTAGFPQGSGYPHFKWRLNGGAWSAETAITNPIVLTGLTNGSYTVEVSGKRDSGLYQDAADFGASAIITRSRTWTVNTALPGLRLNEVLARNVLTLKTNDTSPDLVELFNAGSSTVDLSGMGLTDDAANKYKFTFAPGTTLAPGQFLVLYSEASGNAARNLGFGLNANGSLLSLYQSAANGGARLDNVNFGLQLTDLSIGRLADGSWDLCVPTFGGANVAQPVSAGDTLKINEWLASGSPTAPDDFVELFNPDPVPTALGGLYLTDAPDGSPMRHQIAPLSFIAARGYFAFEADGNTGSGPEHLNFRLSANAGSLGLFAADLTLIDRVAYGPQFKGVSHGRTPNGAPTLAYFNTPTPGAGNPDELPVFITNIVYNLMDYPHVWRYNQSNNLDGISWMATGYDDSAWQSGPGLLGYETATAIAPLINTTLLPPHTPPPGLSSGHAYYFRTALVVTNDLTGFTIAARRRLDDAAVIYINGVEFSRPRMPSGVISNLTIGSSPSSGDAIDDEYFNIPASWLPPGTNIIAVQVHQSVSSSTDIVWGMGIEASRFVTNTASVLINEVIADNSAYTNADGTFSDWVELYNPSGFPVSLAGYSLSDNPSQPGRWVFPAGASIAAGGYLLVRCDSATPASTTNGPALNTGFGLDSSGDAMCLTTPGNTLFDSIVFGPQATDFSLARQPDGATTWVLGLPTPAEPNIAATLGDANNVRINEWAASVTGGPDWFELYNPNPQPVALGGLFLTDALANRTKHPIAALSFLGVNTNGWCKFIADGNMAQGPEHVNFSLAAGGEALGLFPPGTAAAIDTVVFGAQTADVSEGRFPDGATNRVFFTKPSPGAANWLYLTNLVINEVLTHTDLPLEDAVELRNLSAAPVDVSGWFLSDDLANLRKIRIPNDTIIPAGGYKVFYEADFNPQPALVNNFSFSSAKGDDVWLTAADTLGNATGYRDYVKFGPQFNGVSFGRFVTSLGVDYPAMTALTFGTGVNAQSPTNQTALFRTGAGAANTYPRIGPVIISEIMYHPLPIGTNDNLRDEFVELHNVTGSTVPLYDPAHTTNGWRMRGGVDFDFKSTHSISPGGFLLLVSFDPATNAAAVSAFRAAYGTNGMLVGPYSGKLDNGGEQIALYAPDAPQTAGPDVGLVPYVLIEQVVYSDKSPWPTNADGFGPSLQRVSYTSYGNDPVNWLAAAPTAGTSGETDTDMDGMPDWWEDANQLNKLVNDAGIDSDLDGFTNCEEYIAGTDPKNAASRLSITSVTHTGSGLEIRFTAAAGRTYTVLHQSALTAGNWLKLMDVAAQPATQQVTVFDSAGPEQTVHFYRLATPAMP